MCKDKKEKNRYMLTNAFIGVYVLILLVAIYLIYGSFKYNHDFPTIYFIFTVGVVIFYNFLIPKILPNRNKFLDIIRYICNVFYIVSWIYMYL